MWGVHMGHAPVDKSDNSGYNIARMRHEIIFAPEAAQEFRRLTAQVRAVVCDAIERHLRYEPAKESKSRIKRLRGLSRPEYRLRVGEMRVYYDIVKGTVEILAIITKSEAEAWLQQAGKKQ
jgi:mRNA interferase RelE/StbE